MATQKKQSEEKNRNPKLIIDLTKKEIEDNTWMVTCYCSTNIAILFHDNHHIVL